MQLLLEVAVVGADLALDLRLSVLQHFLLQPNVLDGLWSPGEIDRLGKLILLAVVRTRSLLAVSDQADLLSAQVESSVSYHVVLQLVHRLQLVEDRALRSIQQIEPHGCSTRQDP